MEAGGATTPSVRRYGPLLLLSVAACFGGEGTLGGACERDDDCGGDQSCSRSVCGLCDDGIAQAGELCFDDPQVSTAQAPDAASLARIDMNADGVADIVWADAAGLGVALATDGGFEAATMRTLDVTAVWSGDANADGVVDLVTRDAASGASLWRVDAMGELVRVDLDLEPMRGLTHAVVRPEFGIVAAGQRAVTRVEDDGASMAVEFDDDITHLITVDSVDSDGAPDVLAVIGSRSLIGIAATEDAFVAQPGHQFSTDILDSDILDVAAISWNGDAFGDVVVLFDRGQAQIWLSDGQGGFAEGPSVALSLTTSRVLAFDATDDLEPDVLGYGPETDLRLAIRRGAGFDAAIVLDEGNWRWLASSRVGSDRFVDLVLYDGDSFAVLEGTP